MDRLPTEVLAHIFLVGIFETPVHETPLSREWPYRKNTPTEPTWWPTPWTDDPGFPLLASLVCRRWRLVSRGTPGLWTSINTRHLEGLPALKTCLSLSSALPIDVAIQSWALKHADDLTEAMGALVPHLGRMRTLSLSLYRSHTAQQAVGLFFSSTRQMPILQAFHMNLPHEPIFFPIQPIVAPRLRVFAIDATANYLCRSGVSTGLWSSLCQAQESLSSLVIQSANFDHPSALPMTAVNLDYLCFVSASTESAARVVRLLDAPRLRALELDFDQDDCTDFVDAMVGRDGRRGILAHLTHLKIHDLSIGDGSASFSQAVRGLWNALPELAYLFLHLGCMDDEFVWALFPESDGECAPLPRLKTLDLRAPSSDILSQLCALLGAREAAGAPLENLRCTYYDVCDDLPEDGKAWLRSHLTHLLLSPEFVEI